MPTHLVLCHRAGQTTISKLEHVPVPPLGDYIRLYELLASACGAFVSPTTVGIALNTAHIANDEEALEACQRLEGELGLPCEDPVRHGMDRVARAISNA
jgi:uncharacterized NAD-dependent epimerase/dehydratase family protein